MPPLPPESTAPKPGEHVIVPADTGDTFSATLQYIWKFQPDISFTPETVAGRWKYITAVGNIGADMLANYRQHGAQVVDHIDGTPAQIKMKLGAMVAAKRRFLSTELADPPVTPPTSGSPEVPHLCHCHCRGQPLLCQALTFSPAPRAAHRAGRAWAGSDLGGV